MDGRRRGRWTAALLLAVAAGCEDPTTPAQPITGPGDYERSFGFGGAERGYELHVPASVDLSRPSPLVLVFHGVPRARGMRVYTGLDAVADEQGFVVAYMLAHPRHGDWAVGCPLCTNAEAAGVDDVGYVRAALDRIGRELPVDGGRVYAAGFSQGAVFAQRLGCDLSGRVTAIASVAATMIEAVAQRCDPSPPVSALFVHGTEDLEFPWDGAVGSTVRLLSAPAMVGVGGDRRLRRRIGARDAPRHRRRRHHGDAHRARRLRRGRVGRLLRGRRGRTHLAGVAGGVLSRAGDGEPRPRREPGHRGVAPRAEALTRRRRRPPSEGLRGVPRPPDGGATGTRKERRTTEIDRDLREDVRPRRFPRG